MVTFSAMFDCLTDFRQFLPRLFFTKVPPLRHMTNKIWLFHFKTLVKISNRLLHPEYYKNRAQNVELLIKGPIYPQ